MFVRNDITNRVDRRADTSWPTPTTYACPIPVIQELATIRSLVAKKWCIDEGRVDLTGHSDGGMAADANAYRGPTTRRRARTARSTEYSDRRDWGTATAEKTPARRGLFAIRRLQDALQQGSHGVISILPLPG